MNSFAEQKQALNTLSKNTAMDQFIVPIKKENLTVNFEIRDYPHDDDHTCKFEVYLEDQFVASFEPDRHGHLHICKNPGKIERETLHTISDEIEKHHW
ncbi:MAG TPA: hypothetical protein VNI52_07430 [Sphingobacteriaceae bacterium]|nr:hypothetical protein [Sphingobacteriaceae bacterium]